MNFPFDTDPDFWLSDSGFHFHTISLLLSTHDQDFLKRSGLFPQTRLVPDMKKKHMLVHNPYILHLHVIQYLTYNSISYI